MNEVIIEFDIQKPYTRGNVFEYRYGYTIFEASSQGPIEWGYGDSKEITLEKARKRREYWQKYFDKEFLLQE